VLLWVVLGHEVIVSTEIFFFICSLMLSGFVKKKHRCTAQISRCMMSLVVCKLVLDCDDVRSLRQSLRKMMNYEKKKEKLKKSMTNCMETEFTMFYCYYCT